MVHNQIQQVQQKMSHVNQLLGQLRQSEENTHQKLMQIAQGESHVAQQLQRVQQICQESLNNLQSISGSLYQQNYSPGQTQAPMFGSGGVFSPSTMSSGSYQGAKQFTGAQSPSGMGMMSGGSLSSVATMRPDTYQASREQFGQAPASLSEIGQQAGISTK